MLFGAQTLSCALRRRVKCQSVWRENEREMPVGSGGEVWGVVGGWGGLKEKKAPRVELVR